MPNSILKLGPECSSEMEALHTRCFSDCWTTKSFLDLFATGAEGLGILNQGQLASFLFYRRVFDEVEILTFATDPNCRRKGYAKTLLNEVLMRVTGSDIKRVLLEVETSNSAAIALYQAFDFETIATRNGYYKPTPQGTGDAFVMELKLE